jgi:hypothetical protein
LAPASAFRAKPLLARKDRSGTRLKERVMTKVLIEVLAANEAYAGDFGDKGKLPLPPGRRFAILTCIGCTARSSQIRRPERG